MRSVLYFLSVMRCWFMTFRCAATVSMVRHPTRNRVPVQPFRLFNRIPCQSRRPDIPKCGSQWRKDCLHRGASPSTVLGTWWQGTLQRTGAAGLRKFEAAVEAAGG